MPHLIFPLAANDTHLTSATITSGSHVFAVMSRPLGRLGGREKVTPASSASAKPRSNGAATTLNAMRQIPQGGTLFGKGPNAAGNPRSRNMQEASGTGLEHATYQFPSGVITSSCYGESNPGYASGQDRRSISSLLGRATYSAHLLTGLFQRMAMSRATLSGRPTLQIGRAVMRLLKSLRKSCAALASQGHSPLATDHTRIARAMA